jgi:DNA-binding NtrC family response regulator
MMTGCTEDNLVKRAISQGAYTCLHKPFDMEKVIALVENLAKERKE